MKAVLIGWLTALLMGCASTSAHEPVPALIVGANTASRAELQHVVSKALGRQRVVLADDALTSSSDLIIESTRPRDGAGQLLNGRVLRAPDHFQLLVDGARCYLRHEGTGRRYALYATRCRARGSAPPAQTLP
jgi:hypothetical protein